MDKKDIKPGMVLRNKNTGQIGVLYTGQDFGIHSEIDNKKEILIIYKGDDKNPSGSIMFDDVKCKDLEPYKLTEDDLLTEKHIKGVCKPGSEDTCAYLIMTSCGFECAKVLGDQSIANIIDDRLRVGTMNATGDNCGGRYKSGNNL